MEKYLKNQILWDTPKIQVILPLKPVISQKEGIHFVVSPKSVSKPYWEQERLKPLFECAFFALSLAHLIITDPEIPDFWSNIQWNAFPGFNQGVNVFGRNPASLNWGKPVEINKNLEKVNYPSNFIRRLREKCRRQLNRWTQFSSRIILFRDGVQCFPKGTFKFTQAAEIFTLNRPPEKKKDVAWVNKKFILVIPQKPHLAGYHFQIFPRLSYWQPKGGFKCPWQLPAGPIEHLDQIRGYLEATAILFGVTKIISEDATLPFFNPEIHFSGNWNKDLQTEDKGGKLPLEYLEKNKNKSIKEKKKIINSFSTVGHGHLYATNSPKKFVKLPSRPAEEVPEEWAKITPLSEKKVKFIQQLLQDNLSFLLEENCRDLKIEFQEKIKN